jgi:hypothetical protein
MTRINENSHNTEVYSFIYVSCYMLPAGFSFGLFFDFEGGRDMFLRNVLRFSTNYTVLYPSFSTPNTTRCKINCKKKKKKIC